MTSKKIYLISLAVVLLASFYPIYMGIVMLESYFKYGGVDVADYPKYIIPYTPICFAIIICVSILPLIYRLKRIAFPLLSTLGVGLFLIAELFFEKNGGFQRNFCR
jgi:glucan phosphoethanolaminetransferase (alkaline phosphatase superfamily)